jgi:hypothetical protein
MRITMNTEKAPIRNGLRDIPMSEFWKDPLVVVDTVQRKLGELPIDARKLPQFAQQMDEVTRLLKAIGQRRYSSISLLAVLDVMLAMDYFLVLQDEQPDSRGEGYEDDAQELAAVFCKHQGELEEFRVWFRHHGRSARPSCRALGQQRS